jgi:hypothetical protein
MIPNEKKSELYVVPYVPGYAEYAACVREEILKRKDTNFVIAVDLPHGLESQVLEATKKLPEASVLVDRLMRGIPITPTSAPIEAVRSFLEYGLDIRFIDTSLPVIGNLDDYQLFVNACTIHGIDEVLQNPEKYSIPSGDIFKSWICSEADKNYLTPFVHVPSIATEQNSDFRPEKYSSYYLTRLQYMALKIKEMLKEEVDILLVCSTAHTPGILHYLEAEKPVLDYVVPSDKNSDSEEDRVGWDSENPPIDDGYVVPSSICSVSEEDMVHLTYEIPFIMYLYELYRDMPIDRMSWLRSIFSCTEYDKLIAGDAKACALYSGKLALTDQQLYPDLYNTVAAAKYIVNDSYGIAVFDRARSYPPNKGKESEISIRDLLDYNLRSLGSTRVLKLKRDLIETKGYRPRKWKEKKEKTYRWGYSRWTRTPESQQAERDFLRYITARFTFREPSEDQFTAEECVCGLGEGFDVRETIRNWNSGKIYYKEPVMENTACYVLDYRPFHQMRQTGSTQVNLGGAVTNQNASGDYPGNIFYDKYYPWIGVAWSKGNHYDNAVLVAFSKLSVPSTQIFCNVRPTQPLKTAVEEGLKHTKTVFVFTDSPQELDEVEAGSDRIKVLPTSTIPYSVFEKMSTFDIAYMRYDNKRGD